MQSSFRPIAFYLPQFYPNRDNNIWWGKGFTEWSMVTQAKPLFNGHYQPQLPKDLGYYDLRLIEVMEEQAMLAKESGIFGFMFYHYWFHGKRFLDLPVNNYIKYLKPEYPFCLCWANETWTRVWKGKPNEILMEQTYSNDDFKAHITYLCEKIFPDKRYIRVNGKPLFGVWDIKSIPDISGMVDIWQKKAIEFGFPGIYLISIDRLSNALDPSLLNIDAMAEFVPDWKYLPEKRKPNMIHKILNIFKIYRTPYYDHVIMEYKELVELNMKKKYPPFKCYPGITPCWDNTSRRQKRGAHVFHDADPALYEKWLKHIHNTFKPYSNEENFIFINAWNEWAEGAHLEPCNKYENMYLLATKRIFNP